MIRSMTGFGRGEAREAGKEFLVEIRTVNHRYFDIFIKLPKQLTFLEEKVRELTGRSISRGKTDIFVNYNDTGDDSKNVVLDDALAKAYIKAAGAMRDNYDLKDDITVSMISRFPDVLRVEKPEEDEEKLWQLLKKALEDSLKCLVTMRENEGEELKRNILEKAIYIEEILKEIKQRSPEVVKEYKSRLENRIRELLDQQVVDEARITTEVAIFADRCSIDEEITRLGSHISQLRDTFLMQGPSGRKLDFIIQELNREINTIGSKANDLIITRNVVEIKSELEKIREQIQNIE